MTKICPKCGKDVAAHYEFCSACDFVFPEKEEPEDLQPPTPSPCEFCQICEDGGMQYCQQCGSRLSPVTTHSAAVSVAPQMPATQSATAAQIISQQLNQQKNCPKCGKEVAAHYEFCSACDFVFPEKEEPETLQPPIPPPCEFCQICEDGGMQYCQQCGSRLSPVTTHSTAASVAPQMPATQPATASQIIPQQLNQQMIVQPVTNTLPALDQLAGTARWETTHPPPIALVCNTGKTYQVNRTDILELQIVNQTYFHLNELKIEVTGNVLTRGLKEELPYPLPADGSVHPLSIPGVEPKKAGSDILNLFFSGACKELGHFYLRCKVSISIQEPPEAGSTTNINITHGDGPMFMPNFQAGALSPPPSPPQRHDDPQWQHLPVYWDLKKHEQQNQFFPVAAISTTQTVLDSASQQGLQNIPADSAPRATISLENGDVFHIIAGTNLTIGKIENLNHVHAVLFPIKNHLEANKSISGNHCILIVNNNRLYIKDTSTNGTSLDNKRLIRGHMTMVANNMVISIARKLDLQVKIFTDGEKIICVRLDRLHNKSQAHYILANHIVPMGPGQALPISNGEGLSGFYYFHAGYRKWIFRQGEGSPDQDALPEESQYQEIHTGNERYWFFVS